MKRFILSLLICLAILGGSVGSVLAADTAKTVNLINPIGGTKDNPSGGEENWDIMKIGGRAFNYVLGILGSLVFLVFVYGGVLWLTSAGNEERIKNGTQTMFWAVIGVFVIFGSYAIISLIIEGLKP